MNPDTVITRFRITDMEKPNFNGFITATEHGQQRKRCIRISSGSKQVDSILNG